MKFKEIKAEDFCDSVRDGTHASPKKTSSGKKLITSKHIKENGLDLESAYYISEKDYQEINNRSLVEKNDILYSMIGTIGLIYRVKDNPNYAIKNMGLFKLRDELKSKWLYYYLKTPFMRNYINSLLSGSTQQYITLNNLRNLTIKVPEKIEDFQRIIKILDTIEEKIVQNSETNNNLQEICNNIFLSWFCDYNFPDNNNNPYKDTNGQFIESELGRIPSQWEIGKFEDIIYFSNGYGFKSSELLDSEDKNTYKVFKQGNIDLKGGIREDKTKSWFYKENTKGLENYILKKGDILMCMTDMKNSTSPLLGHTALMNRDNEYIVNQRVGLIRCKKEFADYPYVYTLSNLEYFLNDIRSRANSGVQVNLSTKGICETLIVIPNKEIIKKFDDFARPIYERIFNIQDENKNLEKLRDTLLPKLMNGEIDLENIEI